MTVRAPAGWRTVVAGLMVAAVAVGAGGMPGGTARADAAAGPGAAPARIEVRSADLVVVGVAHGDTMSIHVSRALDNAPVRDATVTVTLRGHTYPTVADVDGGYSFRAGELALPGAAALEFRVAAGDGERRLAGTLQVAAPAGDADGGTGGSLRQMAWWVLNFAVCGGFLWLLAKRRKNAESDPDA